MENKNVVIILLVAILAVVIGYFIGSATCGNRMNNNGMHRMPNGEMMMNEGSSMGNMMHQMSASLEGKTGDVFDEAFLKEMIVHHEGAVVMAKQVLATSKRPELIKLANDIITAQTGEIKMMGDWQKAWFK